MGKKYSPRPPDIKFHRSFDVEYLRELLDACRLSQRGAATVLGINERTMRYKVSGKQSLTYAEQYLLEAMADLAPHTKDVMTAHSGPHDSTTPPLEKIGKS